MTDQPSGVKLPTSETLLPCWCANALTAMVEEDDGQYRVACQQCRLQTMWCVSRERAVERWNTRQPTSPALPTDEMIEAGCDAGGFSARNSVARKKVADIYLAMQAKAPATSVGGVGLVERALNKIISLNDLSGLADGDVEAVACHHLAECESIASEALAALAQPTVAVGGLREALLNLAIKTGELIVATDGQEAIRTQRQGALDATKTAEAALSQSSSPVEVGPK